MDAKSGRAFWKKSARGIFRWEADFALARWKFSINGSKKKEGSIFEHDGWRPFRRAFRNGCALLHPPLGPRNWTFFFQEIAGSVENFFELCLGWIWESVRIISCGVIKRGLGRSPIKFFIFALLRTVGGWKYVKTNALWVAGPLVKFQANRARAYGVSGGD